MQSIKNLTPSAEEVQQQLLAAFNEPFPIRGWTFDLTRNPLPDEHRFVFYSQPPNVDEHGALVPGEQPLAGEVLTTMLKIEAKFKLGPAINLLGNTLNVSREVFDKQFMVIHCPQYNIDLEIRAGMAQSYHTEGFHPDMKSFQAKTQEWVEKLSRATLDPADTERRKCLYVLAELKAIRDNALFLTRKEFGTLANLIVQNEPDYWTHLEAFMRGNCSGDDLVRLTKEVVRAVVHRDRPVDFSIVAARKPTVN